MGAALVLHLCAAEYGSARLCWSTVMSRPLRPGVRACCAVPYLPGLPAHFLRWPCSLGIVCLSNELGVGPGRGLGTPFPQETPNPQPVCSSPECSRFLFAHFPVYIKLYVVTLITSEPIHVSLRVGP